MKKEENQIEYIPGDIIFEILTRLPAKFLHNYGRNVCQEWADLIDSPKFIDRHSSRSGTELLIQWQFCRQIKFLEVNQWRAVLKSEPRDFSGLVMNCCRGITLFCLSEENFSFCVANIVTKQTIELPSAPLHPKEPILVAIGYDYLRGEYKVICFCICGFEAYCWLFFTVGKDEAWRRVDLVSSRIWFKSFFGRWWMSVGGIIYGVNRGSNIIAVDVSDESTRTVDVPDDEEETTGGYCVGKKKLTYISHGRKETTVSVYRLEDFRESAWVKMYKFRLHPRDYRVIEKGESVAWVGNGNGELLVFKIDGSLEIGGFSLRTGSCKVLKRLPLCVQFFESSRNLIRL